MEGGTPQRRTFWDAQYGAKKTKHPSFPSPRDWEPAEMGWCRGEGWQTTAGGAGGHERGGGGRGGSN